MGETCEQLDKITMDYYKLSKIGVGTQIPPKNQENVCEGQQGRLWQLFLAIGKVCFLLIFWNEVEK